MCKLFLVFLMAQFCSSPFLGMGKDKTRAKLSTSKARTQKEHLAEDAEHESQNESLLTECKSYLCSIFVHWEPVVPLSKPHLANTRDKLDPTQLASDTAHLLTKWSLRCLVEQPHDEKKIKEFLRWVKKVVIEYEEAINIVLPDSGLKADLLRLHHHAFEAHCYGNISSKMETFQLFTDIMMCMLEAQGNLPALHQAVVSACLRESKNDQSRCGKSLPSVTAIVHSKSNYDDCCSCKY